jgi:mRNA (guanine-N7-)-methyltransferase
MLSPLNTLDIADLSIEQARTRYAERNFRFPAKFFVADCWSEHIAPKIAALEGNGEVKPPFDVVSVQFAFHYAFESEEKTRMALRNISESLKSGGVFIGTMTNAHWIVKKLRSISSDSLTPLSFGNSIYTIRFDQKDEYPTFGHRYTFRLEDAIDDCPEYLVHWGTLVELAKEYKLKPLERRGFHQFFDEMSKIERHREVCAPSVKLNSSPKTNERKYYFNHQLLYKMNVLNEDGSFSAEEWEAAGKFSSILFSESRALAYLIVYIP